MDCIVLKILPHPFIHGSDNIRKTDNALDKI